MCVCVCVCYYIHTCMYMYIDDSMESFLAHTAFTCTMYTCTLIHVTASVHEWCACIHVHCMCTRSIRYFSLPRPLSPLSLPCPPPPPSSLPLSPLPLPLPPPHTLTGGESGSADTARDPRGFAVKLYTDEGLWDLTGNNTPIFFIRDPLFFPSFIHTQKRNPQTHLKDANMFWDFITLRAETCHQVSEWLREGGGKVLCFVHLLFTVSLSLLLSHPLLSLSLSLNLSRSLSFPLSPTLSLSFSLSFPLSFPLSFSLSSSLFPSLSLFPPPPPPLSFSLSLSVSQVSFLFGDRGIPNGFRHMNGYGSHTFKLVNKDHKAVYCKFHLKVYTCVYTNILHVYACMDCVFVCMHKEWGPTCMCMYMYMYILCSPTSLCLSLTRSLTHSLSLSLPLSLTRYII